MNSKEASSSLAVITTNSESTLPQPPPPPATEALPSEALLQLPSDDRRLSIMSPSLFDENERISNLGYTPILERSLSSLDSILASMGTLYFIGGVQAHFTTAYSIGGELPTLTNWVLCSILVLCIAASMAEICSMYPLCSAVYYWAFKTGGKKWGPFFAWTCAILNLAAWCMSCATDALAATKLIISEPILFNTKALGLDYSSIEYRALQFGISIGILGIAAFINLFPHRHLWITIRLTALLMLLLYIINIVWLPVGVSRTYGFQSTRHNFTRTENTNAAPDPSYNWFVNVLFPMYSLIGFDAAGHLSEETHRAHTNAPAGMFRGTLYSAILAIPLVITFVFCFPGYELLQPLNKLSQPLVGMYYLALGETNQLFVVILSIFLFMLNTVLCLLSASRLVFALARDGLFPDHLQRLDKNGEPSQSILFVFVVASLFLATVVPSESAYNSLTSSAVICFLASFLIVLYGRIFITGNEIIQDDWNLGIWSGTSAWIAFIGSIYVTFCLVIPQTFPIEASNINYSSVILFILVLASFVTWHFSKSYRVNLNGLFHHIPQHFTNDSAATEKEHHVPKIFVVDYDDSEQDGEFSTNPGIDATNPEKDATNPEKDNNNGTTNIQESKDTLFVSQDSIMPSKPSDVFDSQNSLAVVNATNDVVRKTSDVGLLVDFDTTPVCIAPVVGESKEEEDVVPCSTKDDDLEKDVQKS